MTESVMPKRSSNKPKRPTDTNQLAASIVALATGEAEPEEAKEQPTEGEVRHAAAVALGR